MFAFILSNWTADLAAFGKPGEVYLSVGYVQGFHLSTLGEGRVYLLRIIYLVVEVDAGKRGGNLTCSSLCPLSSYSCYVTVRQ